MAKWLAGWLAAVLVVSSFLLVSNPARGQAEPDAAQPAAAAVDERAPVEVPQPSAKAMEFYNGGMALWAFNRVWGIVLPALLVFSGFSARLRDLAARVGGRVWFLTVGIYIVLYLAVVFLIELPIDYYQGFARLHAYGLSNQSPGKWLKDSVLDLVLSMAVGFGVLWVPYLLMKRSPRRWWLYTSLASVPFLLFVMLVKPIWIDPLYNDFGPMRNQGLERSILDLAGKAGIDSSRVFEVAKSVDTKAVNAYVTGFLGTKRIVLWDTLLARLNEKEVLFVMAHEMGHYVLGHVVRSVFLSFVVTLLGLYFVHAASGRLIQRFRGRLGFDQLSDVASVPLMLLLLQISSLFLSPVAMAYSRYQEHEADRFAIELTHANHSGGTAFAKLQTENLGNPRPGWVYRVFRASHPSIGERIDFCNSYHPATAPAVSPGAD
ncbi:M48 family metallopeptidase [Paludisphaera borealis]|uniref:Protease HtpX n=1 Tax=Paludisphaera borealis TaxID=1387353 RepID=A0A1U7CQL0_9BACT|nr:M48 family metallopeptidase [Paludisphaera borealis]APW61196.1 Protease HtpX [Paludisphaera borealis]